MAAGNDAARPAGRSDEGLCSFRNNGQVGFLGYDFGGGSDGTRFNCESQDQRYSECRLPVDGRARMVRRLSKAPCDEGQSRGQRGDRVWVDKGCRAEFEVQRGGSGGPGGMSQRVEAACLAEARRQYITVQRVTSALFQASCFYETRSGQTRLEQLRPQPR